MSQARYIGEDFRSAVDWLQERLRTTRPLAEETIWSAIHARTVIWAESAEAGGVFLLEDDEELERRKRTTVRSRTKAHSVARRWSRIQFRHLKRFRNKMAISPQRDLSAPGHLPEASLPHASLVSESAPSASWLRLILRLLEEAER